MCIRDSDDRVVVLAEERAARRGERRRHVLNPTVRKTAMYLPSHFAEHRPEVLQQLIRTHPFGLLVTQGEGGLSANGMPFIHDAGEGTGHGVLRTHVARANPVWREARGDVDSLVVFQGAQAYICLLYTSPSPRDRTRSRM